MFVPSLLFSGKVCLTSCATNSRRKSSLGNTGWYRAWLALAGICTLSGGAHAQTKYEAETAALTGVSLETVRTGYSGSGYVDGFDATNDQVTFTVNVARAGDYPLVIRYASPMGDKPQYLVVNGTTLNQCDLAIASNAAWTSLKYGNVKLNAGNNTIAVVKCYGYFSLDYITVGTAPPTATTYEAEQAALTGVATATSEAGFTGKGYVDGGSLDGTGDNIKFTVAVPAAGAYPVKIRFKNTCGTCEKYQDILINNGSPTYTQLNGTAGKWEEKSLGDVALNAGTNTIEIRRNWGYTHIDNITVGASGPAIITSGSSSGSTPSTLIDAAATTETKNLWNYLNQVYGKKVITGIWEVTGLENVHATSGKVAAIHGEDMTGWHPRLTPEWEGVMLWQRNNLINHYNNGGIVQVNWHWDNPLDHTKTAWSGLTAAQWNNLVTPGTAEYNTVMADIDLHVENCLKKLIDKNGKPIPVLFRPLHEIDGGWFWWTNLADPSKTVALYKMVFDRIKNYHGLHNLIWVWNNSEAATSAATSGAFYPGANYADIVGIDLYHIDYQNTGKHTISSLTYKDYYNMLGQIAPGKPRALCEADALPNPDKTQAGDADFPKWLYALAWWSPSDNDGSGFCYTSPCNPAAWVASSFTHDVYLTLDELGSVVPALVSVPAPVSVSVPAPAAFNGTYQLVARHSGKALAISGASAADGGGVVQQIPAVGSLGQQWQVTAVGGGYYQLLARHSGKALDVNGASAANGAKVQQWTANGSSAQRWKIEATSDGYYRLSAECSGKALDVNNSSDADGAAVYQWDYVGGNNQQWKLEPVGVAATASSQAVTTNVAPAASAASAEAGLQAYPNPSRGQATLAFSAATAQRVTVYVHDQHGRLVTLLTVPAQAGRTDFRLPATLAPGLYHLRARIDGQPQHFTLQVE